MCLYLLTLFLPCLVDLILIYLLQSVLDTLDLCNPKSPYTVILKKTLERYIASLLSLKEYVVTRLLIVHHDKTSQTFNASI